MADQAKTDLGQMIAVARKVGKFKLSTTFKSTWGRDAVRIKVLEHHILQLCVACHKLSLADIDAKPVKEMLEELRHAESAAKKATKGPNPKEDLLEEVNGLEKADKPYTDTYKLLSGVVEDYYNNLDGYTFERRPTPLEFYTEDSLGEFLKEAHRQVRRLEGHNKEIGPELEKLALDALFKAEDTVQQTLVSSRDPALAEVAKTLLGNRSRDYSGTQATDHARSHLGSTFARGEGHLATGSNYTGLRLGGNSVTHAGDNFGVPEQLASNSATPAKKTGKVAPES